MAEEKAEVKQRRPTAKKRDLQSNRRQLRNKAFKAKTKTAIRRFEEAIEQKDENVAKERLSHVYSLMDKGVKRGVYKLNKASRTKSRLTAKAQ